LVGRVASRRVASRREGALEGAQGPAAAERKEVQGNADGMERVDRLRDSNEM
jgi:hypothetical protein